MKRLMILAFTLFAVLFTGCEKEPKIYVDPESIKLGAFGDFPEGDSKFDELLVEIQHKYNFMIYYKNILNKNFSPAKSDIGTVNGIYAADEQELPDELKPHYINFLQRHVLDYFEDHTDWFPKIMRKNFMFVTNYTRQTSTTMGGQTLWTTVRSISDFNLNLTGGTVPALGAAYLGSDYVSLCLFSDFDVSPRGVSMPGTKFYPPQTREEFKRLRAQFMSILFQNAVQAEKIAVPYDIFEKNGIVFTPALYRPADAGAAKKNLEGYIYTNGNQDAYYSKVTRGTGKLAQTETDTLKNVIEAPGYYKTWGSLTATNGFLPTGFAYMTSAIDTTASISSISHYYNTRPITADAYSVNNLNLNAKSLFLCYIMSILGYDMVKENLNTPGYDNRMNWYYEGTPENLWQDANYPQFLHCGKTMTDARTIELKRIQQTKDDIIAYMKTYGFDLLEISKGPDELFVNLLAE